MAAILEKAKVSVSIKDLDPDSHRPTEPEGLGYFGTHELSRGGSRALLGSQKFAEHGFAPTEPEGRIHSDHVFLQPGNIVELRV